MSNTPKVRFAGFTGDWEQRKLGDLADIVGGGTPSTTVSDFWDGDINWYSPAEIADQIYVESSQRKITKAGYDNSSAKMLPVGTVLFTSRAGIGKTAILVHEACTNQGFQSIVPYKGELDSYFIFSRTQELKKYGETVGAGSTFVEVSGKQMLEMLLRMPPTIDEQQSIGEVFDRVDSLIALQQRQYEKLVSLKSACLNKMFPKNGRKVPELRFAGFTGDWEQRKFSDFVQRESAFRVSSSEYPSVEYEDVVAEEGRLNKDVRQKETQKTGIIFDGTQVLYGKLRPYLHNWLNPDFTGAAVGDWWVLRPVGVDKKFLYRLIQTQQFDEVANQSSGSKMPRADWNLVSNTEFIIPSSLDEQRQVAETFDDLDDLITLHQRKLEKLKQLKQSMLYSMFV